MQKILFTMVALAFCCRLMIAEDDVSQLAQDNSAFAFDLYGQLSSKQGNVFFSPYSITTALAMTQAGARGETAAQMATALHFSLPQDRLPAAFAQLQSSLNAAQGEDKVTLSVANSIWPSDHYKILDGYTNLLKSDFGAEVTSLDYSKSDAASNTINQWVEAKTKNKIKNLIEPGSLGPDTKLTLTNAIYFFGKWRNQFPSSDTQSDSFYLTPDPDHEPFAAVKDEPS